MLASIWVILIDLNKDNMRCVCDLCSAKTSKALNSGAMSHMKPLHEKMLDTNLIFFCPLDNVPPVFGKSFNDSLISGIEEDWSALFVPPVFLTMFQLKYCKYDSECCNKIVNIANMIVNIANMIVNVANMSLKVANNFFGKLCSVP